jgi:membrane fusion protein (multidrug efflux system)
MWIRPFKKLGIFGLLILLSLSFAMACNRGDGGPDESENATENGEGENGKNTKTSDKDSNDGDEEDDEEDEAVPVELVTLERGRIESILRFSTNLEAENDVQVFSEAARKVTHLLVEEGDKIRKDQVLIRLQNEAQQTELARVQSQLAKSRLEFERQTRLFEQELISDDEYNEATYALEQLELSLNDAKRELGYTEVRAPITGTLTERFVNVGDHITVNQHLFDITDFNSIVARIYVPEKELFRLRVGQNARIFAEAAGAGEKRGTVDRVAPRVDPRSGTVKVTVAIPPTEGLLPGMYVTVELITDVHEEAVLVPKKALVYDADQLFVFRVKEDDLVERLLIRATLEDRDNIEPTDILESGDRIVIAGQASLKDGSKIRLVGAAAAADEAGTEGEASDTETE